MAIVLLILGIKSIAMYTNTNFIYDMAQLDGELVMATSGGIVSYSTSGNSFSVLDNSSGLPTNLCYSVAVDVDQDTIIWVGSRKGLTEVGELQILNYPLPIIVSSDIKAIAIVGDTIFAGSPNGLVVIDTKGTSDFSDDEIRIITNANNLISDAVLSINNTDEIWVGTDKGISRFFHDLTYDTSFTMNDGLPGPMVLSIYGQDSVFVGTDSGLALIRDDSIKVLTTTPEEVRNIIQVGDTIFYASDHGFGIYYHGSIWHDNDSLPKNDVRDVKYIDGKRWLGLGSGERHDFWGEGIAYYEGCWKTIKNEGPNSNWISDIEISDNGDIFLSHGYRDWGYCKGASRLSNDTAWTNLNSILPNTMDTMHMVHRLVKDNKGRIWFVHNWVGGLKYFDPEDSTWGFYDSLKTGIPIRGAWDADFDNQDNMLVSIAEPQGLPCALIDSSLKTVIYIGSSVDFVVEIIAEDSGRYWIAYNTEGLELIENNNTPFDLSDDQVQYFTTSEGLPSVNGRAVLCDSKSGLYYLSDKGLTYIIKDAEGKFTLTNFDSNNSPLSSNCKFYTLTEDSQNRIWVLSNIGLYCYDPDLDKWDVYYFSDLGLDLQFRDIEEFQNHGFIFDYPRGAIWFGSKNGLIRVNLEEENTTVLDSVVIYPNPSTEGITIFANLPDDSDITIYSISGKKIAELEKPDLVYKLTRWKWQDDTDVKSGLYLALVKSDYGKKVYKFAIVR